jgi:hypothetical protein
MKFLRKDEIGSKFKNESLSTKDRSISLKLFACQGQTSVDDKDIEKHSGLLQYGNNYGRKNINSSGANVIKLFGAVSYEFS